MEKLSNEQNIKNLKKRERLRIIIIVFALATIILSLLNLFCGVSIVFALITMIIVIVLEKVRDKTIIIKKEENKEIKKEIDKIKKKYKGEKMNKKGFTLIEILAVIIIIGIITMIAVPAVSEYISDSREKNYVKVAKGYIDSARAMITNRDLKASNKDYTYYIPIECIDTDQEGTSPYGDWSDAYVVVTYNGKHYNYYWTSVDTSGIGFNLTINDDLDQELMKRDMPNTLPMVGVGNREKVKKLDKENCKTYIEETAISKISE